MGCRTLYNLIKHLPPDAALWREMDDQEPTHEATPDHEPERIAINDAKQIDAFLENVI